MMGQSLGLSLLMVMLSLQILRANMEAHYSQPVALFTHMKAMLTVHRAVLKAQKHLLSKLEEKTTLSQLDTTHPGELLRVENEIKTSQTKYDNRLSLLEQKLSTLEPLKHEVEAARNELQETSKSLVRKVDEEIKHVQSLGATAKGRPSSGVSRYTESYSENRPVLKLQEPEEKVACGYVVSHVSGEIPRSSCPSFFLIDYLLFALICLHT